jgi:hypothetical protein
MVDKATFVDTIQDATRQHWRRSKLRTVKAANEEKPRLGHWPPPRRREFRLELLKPWKFRDAP